MTALPAPAGDAEPAAGLCRRAVALAARRYGVAAQTVLAGDRRRDVVWARHVAMWLARRAGLSLPGIGRALSCDHTTVLNGVRRVDRAAVDPAVRDQLQQLAAALPRVSDRAAATVCALPTPAVIAALRVLSPVIGDPRRRRLLAERLVDAVVEACAVEGRRRADAATDDARRRLLAAAAHLAPSEEA